MSKPIYFKEKLIKQYGYGRIYHQLVEDLKILEKGVIVYQPVQRVIKCGVLIHPADNLEAHAVGGFSLSFSSKDVCRFCHLVYSDLIDNIHDYGSKCHLKWTEEEYDTIAAAIEAKKAENMSLDVMDQCDSDGGSSSNEMQEEEICDGDTSDEDSSEENSLYDIDAENSYGINGMCPLNVLKSFHCTTGFPPDILHDVFEGVVSQDLLGIIRILSKSRWFSLENYNKSMHNLKYKSHESNDRPQDVPLDLKVKKLKGKACSIWLHLRNFPLIIRDFIIDRDDKVFQLGMLLHELVERLTAQEFREYEICVLEEKIIHYLDNRKELYEVYSNLLGAPKPKTHFLSHYPSAIRLYGPPMAYWTARYESRHRIAKNIAESAKNFKNISLTLSSRQQFRLASVFYHGLYSTSDLLVKSEPTSKNSVIEADDFEALHPLIKENDYLASKIEFKGQTYELGNLVILSVASPDEIKVGLIVSFLIKKDSVYVVHKQFAAVRNSLRYFHAFDEKPPLAITDIAELADFKPLVNHGTTKRLIFLLHHFVSFSYT